MGGRYTGYKVAVCVVQQMVMGKRESVPEAARRFAGELRSRWGLTGVFVDNNILVFLSVGDRAAHISTGKV